MAEIEAELEPTAILTHTTLEDLARTKVLEQGITEEKTKARIARDIVNCAHSIHQHLPYSTEIFGLPPGYKTALINAAYEVVITLHPLEGGHKPLTSQERVDAITGQALKQQVYSIVRKAIERRGRGGDMSQRLKDHLDLKPTNPPRFQLITLPHKFLWRMKRLHLERSNLAISSSGEAAMDVLFGRKALLAGQEVAAIGFLSRKDLRLLDECLTDQDLLRIMLIISRTEKHRSEQGYGPNQTELEAKALLGLEHLYFSNMLIQSLAYYDHAASIGDEVQRLCANDPQEPEGDRRKRLQELKILAMKVYTETYPIGSITSNFTDRTPTAPFDLTGFELSPFLPRPWQLVKIVQNALPQGVSADQIRSIQYNDRAIYPEDAKTGTTTLGLACNDGVITVFSPLTQIDLARQQPEYSYELYLLIQRLVEAETTGTIRHEFAHQWHFLIFILYPRLPSIFIKLVLDDPVNILDSDISNYDTTGITSPRQRLHEVIAEIWTHAADTTVLTRLQREFPGHYTIYRCMSEADFFEQFLIQHGLS